MTSTDLLISFFRMGRSVWLGVGAFVLILLMSCGGSGASDSASSDAGDTITVLAAASTVDAISTLASEFEAERGVRVRTSFAASSTLARQIEAGASADIFISANPSWMSYLIERGSMDSESRIDLLANELILIAPRGAAFDFDMAGDTPLASAFSGRLAIGDPEHVPAGIYGREALQNLGWWDAITGRLVSSLDARSALAFVERGGADAGVVYRSDALASARVVVVASFPVESHTPIRYPAACAPAASESARAFLEFLGSPRASEVFRASGFTPLSN